MRVFAACLLLALVAGAQDEPAEKRDANGDPLPGDSVARYGSARWRGSCELGGIALSPDGRSVAGADDAGRLFIWDASSGTTRVATSADRNRFSCVAWSPSGHLIVTGSRSGEMRSWFSDGRPAIPLGSHSEEVRALAFSADGSLFVSGDEDGEVTLWTTARWNIRRQHRKSDAAVASLAWTPDGRRFAVGRVDGRVEVFDAQDGGAVAALQTGVEGATHVAWAGQVALLAGAGDGTVRRWKAEDWTPLEKLEAHPGPVLGLVVAGDRMVVPGEGQRIAVLGLDGRKLGEIGAGPAGLRRPMVSPDGATLYAMAGARVHRWKLPECEPIDAGASAIDSLAAGKSVVVAGPQRWIEHREAASGKLLRRVEIPYDKPADALVVQLSADGSTYAAWSPERTTCVVGDAASGAVRHELKLVELEEVALSHDGALAAVRSEDSVAVLDTRDGTKKWTSADDDFALVFSENAARLARRGGRSLTIADLTGAAAERSFEMGGEAFALSRDGTRVAVEPSLGDESMLVYDTANGNCLARLSSFPQRGHVALAFDAAGNRLAARTGPSGAIQLWSLESLKIVRTIGAHPGYVKSIVFSADGRRLVTIGMEGTALAWDVGE